MGNSSSSGSTGKQVCISLRGLSHEVCVATTRAEYWRQVSQCRWNLHEPTSAWRAHDGFWGRDAATRIHTH